MNRNCRNQLPGRDYYARMDVEVPAGDPNYLPDIPIPSIYPLLDPKYPFCN